MMQNNDFPPQKIFYYGQIYDMFEPMKKIVRMAKKALIIIDPHFDDSVFSQIAQKRKSVSVFVVKNSLSRLLHDIDVAQFNAQYADSLSVKVSNSFHDRYQMIDQTTLIHVGVSLNYLGKKCFAFLSLDKSNIPRHSCQNLTKISTRQESAPADFFFSCPIPLPSKLLRNRGNFEGK